MDLADLAVRVGPILAFLVGITVIAEISDKAGLFDVLAHGAARLGRGSVVALWLLVVALAVAATAVLSLDTTAVLLTPVVLALARRLELDAKLFALTTVWLANTASLFLPVSNLTNLLAVSKLPGGTHTFAGVLWPAAVASTVLTVAALALIFRRSLRGRYAVAPRTRVADRPLLIASAVVCAAVTPAFATGTEVAVAAVAGALVLVAVAAVRDRSILRWSLVPWVLLVGVSVLFVLVQLAEEHGLPGLVQAAAGTGSGLLDLLRLSGVAALAANTINNLPAYLALESLGTEPLRLAALLVGVNAGPIITPWASLATLLWASRCRSAGVQVAWRPFILRGLVLVPVLLVASVGALVLVHG